MNDDATRRARRRVVLPWLVRALVVAWPLAHLVLTVATPRTSWKLGGFGMYAEPHFSSRGVRVRALDDTRRLVLAWPSADATASPSAALERFQLLANGDAAGELVATLDDLHGGALVLLALPHADPTIGDAWHEVVPFAVSGARVVPLQPWSTRDLDRAAVDARIEVDCDEARRRLAEAPV